MSGCVRLREDLEFDSDGTVDGTIVLALAVPAGTGGSLSDGNGVNGFPADVRDRVTETRYEQDGFTGFTYTFRDLSVAEVDQLINTSGEALTGSDITAGSTDPAPTGSGTPTPTGAGSGTAAPTDSATPTPTPTGSDPADPGANPVAVHLSRSGSTVLVTGSVTGIADIPGSSVRPEVRFSLSFPGGVRSTTGQVKGNTVTWTPGPGERIDVNAEGRLDGAVLHGWRPYAIGGGVFVLLLGGVLWALLSRRRRIRDRERLEVPEFDAAAFEMFADNQVWRAQQMVAKDYAGRPYSAQFAEDGTPVHPQVPGDGRTAQERADSWTNVVPAAPPRQPARPAAVAPEPSWQTGAVPAPAAAEQTWQTGAVPAQGWQTGSVPASRQAGPPTGAFPAQGPPTGTFPAIGYETGSVPAQVWQSGGGQPVLGPPTGAVPAWTPPPGRSDGHDNGLHTPAYGQRAVDPNVPPLPEPAKKKGRRKKG